MSQKEAIMNTACKTIKRQEVKEVSTMKSDVALKK